MAEAEEKLQEADLWEAQRGEAIPGERWEADRYCGTASAALLERPPLAEKEYLDIGITLR